MKPVKPLSNQQRVVILQAETGKEFDHLADLEIEHFGSNRLTRMIEIFRTKINPIGSFDNKYDDYLLALYDDQQEPDVPSTISIQRGSLITTVPGITYATNF